MLKQSFMNLSRHKLRTALSVLGIILGVSSLILLVSVVDGIRLDIENAFSKAQGARVSSLHGGDPVLSQLDESWIPKLEKIAGVKIAVGNIIQSTRFVDGKQQDLFSGPRVLGIDVDRSLKATSTGFSGELLEGRDFKSADRGVALIGKAVQDNFDKFVGTKIKVNDKSFTIVGVYTTGSDLIDNSILVPIDDAREATGFPKGKVSYFNVQLVNPKDDQVVVDRINLIYGDKIMAQSLSDFSSQFGQLFDSITALVVILASIASVVAAVGVINTMLMSVLERFKEIGALKAVGWTSENIMALVVFESVLVGIIGGLAGALLGVALAGFTNSFLLATHVSTPLILGSFIGAVFVGLLAGVYPAFVASRMDPVEALRFE